MKNVRHVAIAVLLAFLGATAAWTATDVLLPPPHITSAGVIDFPNAPAAQWNISRLPTGGAGATVPLQNGAHVWTGSDDFSGDSSVKVPTKAGTDSSPAAASTANTEAKLAALSGYLDANFGATRGSVMFRGATGWQSITGLAGTYLKFNGAGADPTAAAPPSGPDGTRTLLNTLTISPGASSIADTSSLTGTWSEYEIDCDNIVPSALADITMRVQVGGSFVATGYVSNVYGYNSTGAAGSPSTTGMIVLPSLAAGKPGTAHIHFSNPAMASNITQFDWQGQLMGSATIATVIVGGGQYTTAGVVTGFSMFPSTGTLTSGYCKIYGNN